MSKRTKIAVAAIVAMFSAAVLLGLLYRPNAQSFRIGAILPLTGDVASYGIAIQQGIQLAAAEVNASGGIDGLQLEVEFEDDRGQARDGVLAAQKLIANSKVPLILGAVPSSVTLALAPIVERENVVLLSPASSAPAITQAGEYIFRNYPSDEAEGRLVAEFALEEGLARAVILTINNDYGEGLNRVFAEAFQKKGQILLNERFPQGTTDFRSLLVRIREQQPACIFVVGYGRELGTIVKQAKEVGITAQFLSTVNFQDSETIAVGGTAAEGVIFSSAAFDPTSAVSKVREFVGAFKGRFNKEPDVWSAHGYDALLIAASAIRSAQPQKTGPAIRDALASIVGFEGVSGLTSFDRNGDVQKPVRFLTVHGGTFEPYHNGK